MENENSPELSETVPTETEIIEQDSLNVISQDLKDLFKFFKDEKDLIEQKNEIENQEKLEADILEKEKIEADILEQKELDQKDAIEKELILKREQELIDSEIEFRENLMTDLKDTNLKLDEVITYNSKSDGFSDDIALVPQKLDLIVENTQQTEIQENNDNIASFADVAMIGLVVVILPIYVVYRFFKAILSPLL